LLHCFDNALRVTVKYAKFTFVQVAQRDVMLALLTALPRCCNNALYSTVKFGIFMFVQLAQRDVKVLLKSILH
jgi:hypothetical protein